MRRAPMRIASCTRTPPPAWPWPARPAASEHDDFYGAELFGDVAYHSFEGITVHDEEGPRLVASLADKRVLILRNHGMLVCGSSVFNAFRWMWTLQRACEVQVAADSLRGANIPLADPVRRACAADAQAFEPRESLEKMLFTSVLRRTHIDAASLAGSGRS